MEARGLEPLGSSSKRYHFTLQNSLFEPKISAYMRLSVSFLEGALTALKLSITLLSIHAQNGLEATTPGVFAEDRSYIAGAFSNSYGSLSLAFGKKERIGRHELVWGVTTGYQKYPTPALALRLNFRDCFVWIFPPYRKDSLGVTIGVRL